MFLGTNLFKDEGLIRYFVPTDQRYTITLGVAIFMNINRIMYVPKWLIKDSFQYAYSSNEGTLFYKTGLQTNEILMLKINKT